MTNQIKKTALRLFFGALMVSFVFAACNNKKDKKDDAPKGDTTTVVPPPQIDTSGMDKDTSEVRPIDPNKPGE